MYKVESSLHRLVNPQTSPESVTQAKLKAAGYLTLGIVVATAAVVVGVALIALGVVFFVPPMIPLGLLVAAPLLWIGYTVTAISINYLKVLNKKDTYWDAQNQSPNDFQIHKDLYKYAFSCCFRAKGSPNIDQNYTSSDPLINKYNQIGSDCEQIKKQIEQNLEQARQMEIDSAKRETQRLQELERNTTELVSVTVTTTKNTIATLEKRREEGIALGNQTIKEIKENPSFNKEDEITVNSLSKCVDMDKDSQLVDIASLKSTLVTTIEALISISNLPNEAKSRILSPYFEEFPELRTV